jgi:hypothetical protein
MHTLIIWIAAAAVGIEAGWQRMPEGGMEYIIQLDPQSLESLRAGEAIQSDIPPSAGDVRSYRIIVGTNRLPRETPPAPPLLADPGGKPIAERPASFVETAATASAAKSPPKAAAGVHSEQPAKPWLPLTFTLFGLFASLGLNVFLGWIAWDFRQQCHAKQSAT